MVAGAFEAMAVVLEGGTRELEQIAADNWESTLVVGRQIHELVNSALCDEEPRDEGSQVRSEELNDELVLGE